MNHSSPEAQIPPKVPRRTRGLLVLAAIVLGGLLVLTLALPASKNTRNDSPDAAGLVKPDASEPPPGTKPTDVALARNRASHSAGTTAKPAVAAPPTAQDLIARLTNLDAKSTLTKEQAARINETFKLLIAQGASAVPAIREYLSRNEDIGFEGNARSLGLDHETIRLGMLNALHEIGGPEALQVALETLRVTADPKELALLAGSIETHAPGAYREETVAAARESLRIAQEGGLGERDVAPLFQIFQSYGSADLIADLQQAFPQWSYYSALTLANLPGGEGIPALVNQLNEPQAVGSGRNEIALQALSQVAANQPDASDALLRMARADQISDVAWTAVALALEGYSFEVGSPSERIARSLGSKSPLETHRSPETGESLFTTPVTASWLEESLPARIALIDQLMAVTSNPTAQQALQDAKKSLQQKLETVSVYRK